MAKSNQSFDLIVIGSGPSGVRAAMQAAKIGKKVAIVDRNEAVGGSCIHVGTIPSKSFRESVYRFSLGSRGTIGQEVEHHLSKQDQKQTVIPDMARLLKRRDRVIEAEVAVIEDHLVRNEIQIFKGQARLKSQNEVQVVSKKATTLLTGEFIFVATGARPVPPQYLKVDGKRILDSDSILNLKKVPKSMVVLGGGIIGCEYASMFSMLGTKVTLVDRRHEILASVDREIVNHMVERFQAQGMEIVLGAECENLEDDKDPKNGMFKLRLSNTKKTNAEVILVTLGRFGNTEDLGLKELGIEVDSRGLVKVDSYFRTKMKNIYAIGDVIGPPALASTAIEQGRLACRHAFEVKESSQGEAGMSPLYPYGIYTIPEISMIGLTEEDAAAQKKDFVVGRAYYKELARGQIVGDRYGLLKLIVEKKTFKILGVHIIGDSAAEIVHIGQTVMHFGGDVNYFTQNVFN